MMLLDGDSLDSVALKEGIDGGFAAAETFVQVHCGFATAALQDVLAEQLC